MLDEKPEDVPEWLTFYETAYQRLAGSRSYTLTGPGPIPVSEVLAFCVLVGMDSPDERMHMLRMVQIMDALYLGALRKRLPN